MTTAAEIADIERTTAYAFRKEEPAFAEKWEAAIQESADRLEEEARRRAFAGSDTLLIFLLKGAKPKKYRDRKQVEHSGKVEGWTTIHEVEVHHPE